MWIIKTVATPYVCVLRELSVAPQKIDLSLMGSCSVFIMASNSDFSQTVERSLVVLGSKEQILLVRRKLPPTLCFHKMNANSWE